MSTLKDLAIRLHNYGDADALKLEQVERPVPAEGEVLVRVLAAGVNPVDWKIRAGWLKEVFPSTFPYIPGADIAGIVEEVGPGVTTLHKGQEVYGQSRRGAYAEYTTAPASVLAPKPQTLSFDAASTVPIGATTAWQSLFDHGGLQPGQKVVILGAAGGVGLFAVQFARLKGAQVIATASTRNLDFVRSLGIDHVVDYTKTDLKTVVQDADLVIDNVGGETLNNAIELVKRGGTLVSIAGRAPQEKVDARGIRFVQFGAQITSELLQTFAKLIDEGQVKVEVSTTFPLDQTHQAHKLSESGHGRGRIVLHIADK